MAKLWQKQKQKKQMRGGGITTGSSFSPKQESLNYKVCCWNSFKCALGFFCACWTIYILYVMLTTHPCLQSTKCFAALMTGTDTSAFSSSVKSSSGPNNTQMAQLSYPTCCEKKATSNDTTPHNAVIGLTSSASNDTTLHNVVFGLASCAGKWNQRKQYVELWWKPNVMRGYVWLDHELDEPQSTSSSLSLPSLKVSEDTSRFRYTFKKGLRSAIRISRIVSETVRLNLSDVHWFIMGDDDTVFFPENLLQVLSKYDHNQYYYIGSNSESLEQNVLHSYGMAFGGGGFAISYPLAKALEKMQDSCLDRYSYLFGSDARIHACLADLGVPLTKEPGFHQVDMRGNLLGWLSAHPLAPLVSLHHLDVMAPIFPKMNQTQAFQHLFKAVKADSSRILQQVICYDRLRSGSFSVSWGYSIHVFDSIQLLRELEFPQHTFTHWRRTMTDQFMFNTRNVSRNPCQRPAVFFLESVSIGSKQINTTYTKQTGNSCQLRNSTLQALKQITILSTKTQFNWKQAPRRQCCDILPSSLNNLDIRLRSCLDGEVIYPE